MKKLITLIALIGLGATANAQRFVDLGVTLTSPAASATITSGSPLAISIIIENHGADSLKVSDSVYFTYTVDNNLLTNSSTGQPLIYGFTGRKILAGDTIHIDNSLTIGFSNSLDGAHTFCALVQAINKGIDSLKDTVATNNSSCSNVTMAGGEVPQSVQGGFVATTGLAATVSVYPNPASNVANFNITLPAASDVTVNVMDIAGRVVMTQNTAAMHAGKNSLSISTDGLTNGMYLYQVIANDRVTSGKFSVVR